jgi:tetratricopeptide (TPR) repeat protein
MLCNNCGTSFPAHEPFCPRCGKPQPIAAVVGQVQNKSHLSAQTALANGAPTASEDPVQAAGAPNRRRWTLGRATGSCLLAFSCVVLIFLAIGGVATYQGLQERVALNRQEAETHYQRGLAHMEAGEYELASAEFEHTLRLDPTHREARDALRETKTLALAQPTPTSATLNEATNAILTEAETLVQNQNWQEATQRLSQLRDLAPDFQPQQVADLAYTAYLNLGLQLVSEGQINEGVHAFEQALAERPDDPEASRQLDLASLYVSAQATWGGDWPSTIDFLEQLYTLTPDYLDVASLLYQAYEAYGDALVAEDAWCLAELQYKEAALLQPGSAIQAKWDEAARICRTPTPTPRPTVRPTTPIITGTATVTATTTASSTRATLSATGSILFSRFNDQELQWEIVAVTPGGDTPTVILSDATQPATSPNGQLLAYHAEVDESEGLHVFNVSTDEDIRATTFREDVTPDWAPDNLRFVFPSQRSGDRRWQVYIGWADGKGDPVPLTDGRTPAWSPDGTLIAYQGTDAQGNNPGLYLISAQGGPATRLTQGESDRAPAWSPKCTRGVPIPNGTTSPVSSQDPAESNCQIAFMSSRDGNWEIYIANVLRGTVTRLTTSSGNNGLPTWSPDGDQIAFVSDRGGSWGVYAVLATGGEAVKVANWGDARANWLVERIAWVR